MGVRCKNCGYERQPSDIAPEYECPKCGIIYAKISVKKKQQPKGPPLEKENITNKDKFHFPDRGRLISLITLSFLLPDSLELEADPANLPTATVGQRIWAAISTFFHGIFMGYVLFILVAIVAGLFFRFSHINVTHNDIDALKGASFLIGLVTSTVLLPLLWRGHSFGQRAMGILVVPTNDGNIYDLSGWAMMIRRLSLRSCCMAGKSMMSRPWNNALQPFAAIIVIHFVCSLIVMTFVLTKNFVDKVSSKTANTYQLVTQTEHTLHQLDPAIRSYIIESGMTPMSLTPTVFKKVLNRYMPPGIARQLREKLDDGSLKLEGDFAEYRIGIFENSKWTILNEHGEISHEEEF